MLNFLVRAIFGISSVVTGIIGLRFIRRGYNYPDKKYPDLLSQESVSAVQVTQVYTEATHIVMVGIGIVSCAVALAVIGILFCSSRPISIIVPDGFVKGRIDIESFEDEDPDWDEDVGFITRSK